MSKIGDFFNRIFKLSFGKNQMKQLNPATRDLMLSSSLESHFMEAFEEPLNYNDYCKDFFSIPGNFENQYDYVELITRMQETGAMNEYKFYLDYVNSNPSLYYPSEVHGVEHTSRVILYAEMLCMLDANILSANDKNLILVAAQLHDIGRENDGKNFDHGQASRYKIEQLDLLKDFSPKDQDIIKFAVESHSLEPEQIKEKLKSIPRKDRKNYKRILDYLQDADKLDRTRIGNPGWGLDPSRLESESAKRLVKVAHQNYFEYDRMMRYQENREKQDQFGNKLTAYLEFFRGQGYNISLDTLNSVLSELKPGTLETLNSQGKLLELFSYETFSKYRKEESFNDRLNPNRIDENKIFEEVTRRQQVRMLEDTLKRDFLLFYNLKKNNKDAYDLACYTELDMQIGKYIGVMENIRLNDLDKLNRNGSFFRLNDLAYLASFVTPEEYTEIFRSGKPEDLYSAKYCKNPGEIEAVKKRLEQIGFSIDEDNFNANFRLLQYISSTDGYDVLCQGGIEKFSIPEIFGASKKLNEAKFRIRDGKSRDFSYDAQTIVGLLEYQRTVQMPENISEEDMLDMVEKFARNHKIQNNPRYIEYLNKKNRPYEARNVDEVLNYKEFCADQILNDPNITLEDAKSKFLNSLFSIDVPESYRKAFENELMDSLYFHKKYMPNSMLETTYMKLMDSLRKIFDTKNIKELKNELAHSKKYINIFNTQRIGDIIKDELTEFSRKDMVQKLQETYERISKMPLQTVLSANGTPVQAKVLSGEEFFMAISTSMPRCSSSINKILNDNVNNPNNAKKEIYSRMLDTPLNPNEVCTTITSDKMVAHAGSSLPNQELKYLYIPTTTGDISIVGMQDLSTVKNKDGVRITQRPTTPRSTEDFVAGIKEEHGEAVMNGYPTGIVCFDKIDDIAIAKKIELEKQYRALGINKKVEIIFVDGKGTYIPRIKNDVHQEHNQMRQKLVQGTFSVRDFENMFEKRESNFALRTLQVLHSTSYRCDNWDDGYNFALLNSMIDIIDKVSQIVPHQKARSLEKVVSTLLERADPKSQYGARFYDQSYALSIDTVKLENIRQGLMQKIVPYEMCQTPIQPDIPKTQNPYEPEVK